MSNDIKSVDDAILYTFRNTIFNTYIKQIHPDFVNFSSYDNLTGQQKLIFKEKIINIFLQYYENEKDLEILISKFLKENGVFKKIHHNEFGIDIFLITLWKTYINSIIDTREVLRGLKIISSENEHDEIKLHQNQKIKLILYGLIKDIEKNANKVLTIKDLCFFLNDTSDRSDDNLKNQLIYMIKYLFDKLNMVLHNELNDNQQLLLFIYMICMYSWSEFDSNKTDIDSFINKIKGYYPDENKAKLLNQDQDKEILVTGVCNCGSYKFSKNKSEKSCKHINDKKVQKNIQRKAKDLFDDNKSNGSIEFDSFTYPSRTYTIRIVLNKKSLDERKLSNIDFENVHSYDTDGNPRYLILSENTDSDDDGNCAISNCTLTCTILLQCDGESPSGKTCDKEVCLTCAGEQDIPEGNWFCSVECRNSVNNNESSDDSGWDSDSDWNKI